MNQNPEEENQRLTEIIAKQSQVIKRIKRHGRGEFEQQFRNWVYKVLDGGFKNYITDHGGSNSVGGARASILKRIVGNLCSSGVRREYIRRVIKLEREIIDELEGLVEKSEETEEEQETGEPECDPPGEDGKAD